MPRNLILCFDGTSNEFGSQNTNVVRLIQVLDRDPSKQRLYYDPGLGTLPEPGVWTSVGKKLSKLFGLAFGIGIGQNVQEAYSYLMDFWEPGDRVYLFGFSRGAYTARILAGMLHGMGLLPRGNQNLLPYVFRLYKAVRGGKSDYWKVCNDFRWTFARQAVPGDDERRFPVHFLGLWDTVSSVGYVWDPATFPFTSRNPSTKIVRHAVAIDERRAFFRQNLFEHNVEQDLQEMWFPGVHADIGGGYAEKDSGLWRMPFNWILEESQKAGLLVDPERLGIVSNKSQASPSPWTDKQHESLTPIWWPAELFPKLVWHRESSRIWPRMGLGRHRFIREKSLIHKSTLLRIRETKYLPPNLSQDLIERVRALSDVPNSMLT